MLIFGPSRDDFFLIEEKSLNTHSMINEDSNREEK